MTGITEKQKDAFQEQIKKYQMIKAEHIQRGNCGKDKILKIDLLLANLTILISSN